MKLLELWKKIGKQPLKETRNIDVIVQCGDDKFFVNKIQYNNGKFECLQAKKISCPTCEHYQKDIPHTCDLCTSSDNDEDYSMWKLRKENTH